jgi:hypothetical protein
MAGAPRLQEIERLADHDPVGPETERRPYEVGH